MTGDEAGDVSRHAELCDQYGIGQDTPPVDVLGEYLCNALDEYLTAWWKAPEHVSLPDLRNDMAGAIAHEAAAILRGPDPVAALTSTPVVSDPTLPTWSSAWRPMRDDEARRALEALRGEP